MHAAAVKPEHPGKAKGHAHPAPRHAPAPAPAPAPKVPAQPARSQVLASRPVPAVSPPAPLPAPHHTRHATLNSAPLGPLVSPLVTAGGALKFMSLQAATNLPVPAALIALFVVAAALFMVFQAVAGGRDPKLARAPVRSDEGSVGFD